MFADYSANYSIFVIDQWDLLNILYTIAPLPG